MVLLVLLKVFGQMIDALRQQRNLDVSRTGVLLVKLKIAYRLCFCIHTYLTNSVNQFLVKYKDGMVVRARNPVKHFFGGFFAGGARSPRAFTQLIGSRGRSPPNTVHSTNSSFGGTGINPCLYP